MSTFLCRPSKSAFPKSAAKPTAAAAGEIDDAGGAEGRGYSPPPGAGLRGKMNLSRHYADPARARGASGSELLHASGARGASAAGGEAGPGDRSRHGVGPAPPGWESRVRGRVPSEQITRDDPGHTYHLLRGGTVVSTSVPMALGPAVADLVRKALAVGAEDEDEMHERAGAGNLQERKISGRGQGQEAGALVNLGGKSMAQDPRFEKAATAFEIRLGGLAFRHGAANEVAQRMCDKARAFILAKCGARWDAAEGAIRAELEPWRGGWGRL